MEGRHLFAARLTGLPGWPRRRDIRRYLSSNSWSRALTTTRRRCSLLVCNSQTHPSTFLVSKPHSRMGYILCRKGGLSNPQLYRHSKRRCTPSNRRGRWWSPCKSRNLHCNCCKIICWWKGSIPHSTANKSRNLNTPCNYLDSLHISLPTESTLRGTPISLQLSRNWPLHYRTSNSHCYQCRAPCCKLHTNLHSRRSYIRMYTSGKYSCPHRGKTNLRRGCTG